MDSLESDWLKDSDSLEDSLLWLDESLLEDELLDDELSEEELDEDDEDDDADEDEESELEDDESLDEDDPELEDDESLEEDELLDELSQQRQSPWVGPNQRIRDPLGLEGTSPGSPKTDRIP